MSAPIALGLDPGFASFGWAAVALEPSGDARIVDLGVIRTTPAKNRRVRIRDDDQRRAAEVARALRRIAAGHRPAVLVAEALSHVKPRGARMPVSTTTKVGRAWGLVDMLAETLEVALVQVAPQTIKKALCGHRSASKADVEVALRARHPEVGGLLEPIPRSHREHPVDAAAAVIASVHSNELRLIRRLARASGDAAHAR